MLVTDLTDLKLTKDEENEYNETVRKIPMQTAYNQLQRMLKGNTTTSVRYVAYL